MCFGANMSTVSFGGGSEREGFARLARLWYVVVIAVVAVGPFAIGVKYSVCDGCSIKPGVSDAGRFGLGIQ